MKIDTEIVGGIFLEVTGEFNGVEIYLGFMDKNEAIEFKNILQETIVNIYKFLENKETD